MDYASMGMMVLEALNKNNKEKVSEVVSVAVDEFKKLQSEVAELNKMLEAILDHYQIEIVKSEYIVKNK